MAERDRGLLLVDARSAAPQGNPHPGGRGRASADQRRRADILVMCAAYPASRRVTVDNASRPEPK
jgi:hypothetical protein